jgi:hypothetical protein
MWTSPKARGCGYAAGLLADLVSWCRDRDLDVRLQVTQGNDAARRLYVGHGFKPTGAWEPLREGSTLQVEELQLVISGQDPAVPTDTRPSHGSHSPSR